MSPRAVLGIILAFALVAALSFVGCTVFKKMFGRDTIDLAEYEVLAMSVDIRKEQKTICPLEGTQMAVFVQVTDPEDSAKKLDLETWQGGSGTRRNGKLDFTNFAFHSEQGTFDEFGTLHPSGGVLTTVAREFEIDYVLKKQPDKFSFKMNYKPDYRCVSGSRHDGVMGSSGMSGQAGAVLHALARALVNMEGGLRKPLRKAGFLTRDAREVERKKYGQPGARKNFQFSKR